MTSSHGNISALLTIYARNSPVTGEFPAQRPVMRSFDAFFDLRPNERLSKQSWGWWFETPSRPLWRHCNGSKTVKAMEEVRVPITTLIALHNMLQSLRRSKRNSVQPLLVVMVMYMCLTDGQHSNLKIDMMMNDKLMNSTPKLNVHVINDL